MKEVVESTGKGEWHLGWLEPGKKVCLGVGPVTLRCTTAEAKELLRSLNDLLGEDCRTCEPGRHSYTPCGCDQSLKPDTKPQSDIRSQFWDGPSWGKGAG